MTVGQENISITNTTKGKLPRLPFVEYKNKILGKKYELGIIFASSTLSHKLNLEYRKKDKPTNILSFPLSKTEGEIYICPAVARTEAKKFGRTYEKFVGLLVIHGLLHLKGFTHGSTMESEEARYRKIFDI
ncbi:MAG: rRNA maturation RNase YbeY [Candidatus Paceibacterota bacterium]|jgi:probable rRNA maturation factor